MKYLASNADLTFKKVSGKHPDVVMSFLNGLLPFDGEQKIVAIEYFPLKQVLSY